MPDTANNAKDHNAQEQNLPSQPRKPDWQLLHLKLPIRDFDYHQPPLHQPATTSTSKTLILYLPTLENYIPEPP